MISNCGSNEFGGVSGGSPGDQTGGEYHVMNWYSRPWNCVLRYPDLNAGIKIAQIARDAANNNNIGYDQPRRMTFYNRLKEVKWNPSAIKTKCDADCSSSSATCIVAAGNLLNNSQLANVSPSLTTHYMRSALRSAGFMLLTDSRYLTSDAYLLPGDILLNDGAHAAVNLDAGSKSGSDVVVSDGSGDVGYGYGGNLYEFTNDENDADMREVAYMKTNGTPTLDKTGFRLSVINYTSSLYAIFEGKVGTTGAAVDVSGVEGNYKTIIEFCMGKGLNAAAACGICGNIQGESNGNPAAVSSDGHYSYGICQWTFGRKTAMLNFVGDDWRTDLTGQLEFLWTELNGSYKNSVLIPLQGVANNDSGARSAALTFVSKFEIPQRYINGRDIYLERQNNASAFFKKLVVQKKSTTSSSSNRTANGSQKLTKSAGRITFNGHQETWYSQKVLPGGGLNIPGRHVASDGTIRDKDNYIVVASDSLPKGSTVLTSLGMGKVYDTGVGNSYTIDIYTNW